jgi:hypothetical protein
MTASSNEIWKRFQVRGAWAWEYPSAGVRLPCRPCGVRPDRILGPFRSWSEKWSMPSNVVKKESPEGGDISEPSYHSHFSFEQGRAPITWSAHRKLHMCR